MTRLTQTKIEAKSFRALERHFSKTASPLFRVRRKIEDNPDFLFKCGGNLVACEATQLPDDKIIRYFHRNRGQSRSDDKNCFGHSIEWAIEPHMWVMQTIRSKSKNVPRYLSNTGASSCWLLLHPPTTFGELFFSPSLEWQKSLLRYGAGVFGHLFEKVFFCFDEGSILEIFSRGVPRPKGVRFNFVEGYPTRSSAQFHIPIEVPVLASGSWKRDFGLVEFEKTIVRPLDPKFREFEPRDSTPPISITCDVENHLATAQLNFQDRFKTEPIKIEMSKHAGTTMHMHIVVHVPPDNWAPGPGTAKF